MWEHIAEILKKYGVSVKIVLDDDEPEGWSPWFVLPTDGYGEVRNYGPFKLAKLVMLLINPIELRRVGQRVSDKRVDHTESISRDLLDRDIEFDQKDGLILIRR